MPESESLFCDVLIIGSGIAGIKAAIEAKTEGLSVVLISKSPVGRQNCSFFAGGLLRPDPGDSKGVEQEPGIEKYLYHPELVPIFMGPAATEEIESLISMGIPLEKHGKDFTPSDREQKSPGGSAIILPLVKKALEAGITCLGNKRVTDLLLSQGQVKGALVMDEKGKLLQISAKATILATGGGAGIFEHNSNPEGIIGEGYVLALRAGAALENMEYMHFYPIGLMGSSFPHQRASPFLLQSKGVALVDSHGEDLVDRNLKMTLQKAISIPTIRFEKLSGIVARENQGNGAYLDLTKIPSEIWETILRSSWNKAFLDKSPINLREQKCRVIPLAHTFMGGVKINFRCETTVMGLFAAGEVVGGVYCGEEGASQLCRCLVMGAIAGRSAVSFVKGLKSTKIKEQDWLVPTARVSGFLSRSWMEKAEIIKKDISKLVYTAMGPIRDGSILENALREMDTLDKRVKSIKIENAVDFQRAIEAENMLILSRALIGAGLRRKESRGPHFREDFPNRDDSWLKRIIISMNNKNQLTFSEENIISRA